MDLSEILKWHFSPETGSPLWVALKGSLSFDPVAEISTLGELARLPDISETLRGARPEELIPRGLADQLRWGVFESGGTSGRPKFLVAFDEWVDQLVEWRVSTLTPLGPGHTLGAIPSGPHLVNAINHRRATRLGGAYFTIDLDPRWVRRLSVSGRQSLATEYVEHLVGQVVDVLAVQDIRYIVTTPPILAALVRDDRALELLQANVARITLGGTTVDLDTIHLLQAEYLPHVQFVASYGSTSALAEAGSGPLDLDSRHVTYSAFEPFVTYDVVDADGQTVPIGERGRVCVSHLSRYAFYPRVVERDTALRMGSTPSGASLIADIRPLPQVNGTRIVEGVY